MKKLKAIELARVTIVSSCSSFLIKANKLYKGMRWKPGKECVFDHVSKRSKTGWLSTRLTIFFMYCSVFKNSVIIG